jgi:AcrR family transcriptional regulator
MPTTQRRKRAIARTREDILEAAARAFSKRGYHSATMRDIAREAGYTAASLYTYFKSKQEILNGLATLVTEELVTGFDEPVPAGLSFRQKLELLTRRQLANVERRRDLFALLMTLHPSHACQSSGRERQRRNPLWHFELQVAAFAEWLRANATPADVSGRDPELVARFLVSIGNGFLAHWVFTARPDEPVVKDRDLVLDLFLHGINGPTTAPRGGHDA